MEISLDWVMDAARRRAAAVTPEVAGYIVLLAAKAVAERPSRMAASDVLIGEAGDVDARPGVAVSEHEAEASLRALLASLLSLSSSPAPAVMAVAQRAEPVGLRALYAELAAALIPINHAAARRALARLFREARRACGTPLAGAASSTANELASMLADARRSETPAATVRERPELGGGIEGSAFESSAAEARDLEIEVDVEAAPPLPPPLEPATVAATLAMPPMQAEPSEAAQGELPEACAEPPEAAQGELPETRSDLPEAVFERESDAEPPEAYAEPPEAYAAPPETYAERLDSDAEPSEAAQIELPEACAERLDSDAGPPRVPWPEPAAPRRGTSEPLLQITIHELDADERSVLAGHRSDVSSLLDAFLGHTRSEERMTRALRELVGIERRAG